MSIPYSKRSYITIIAYYYSHVKNNEIFNDIVNDDLIILQIATVLLRTFSSVDLLLMWSGILIVILSRNSTITF